MEVPFGLVSIQVITFIPGLVGYFLFVFNIETTFEMLVNLEVMHDFLKITWKTSCCHLQLGYLSVTVLSSPLQ